MKMGAEKREYAEIISTKHHIYRGKRGNYNRDFYKNYREWGGHRRFDESKPDRWGQSAGIEAFKSQSRGNNHV